MPDLRIVIVSDDPLARAGLGALLADRDGIVVVSTSASDAALVETAAAAQADAVIWDCGGPADGGLAALADVRDALPPVVVLAQDDARARAALDAGARGVLRRDTAPATLAAAARAAAEGLVVVDPSWGDRLLSRGGLLDGAEASLSARELQVLRLLAEGLPNKTIADRLGVSDNTVKFHVNAIMSKLGAQNRTEAATTAMRLGLIPL